MLPLGQVEGVRASSGLVDGETLARGSRFGDTDIQPLSSPWDTPSSRVGRIERYVSSSAVSPTTTTSLTTTTSSIVDDYGYGYAYGYGYGYGYGQPGYCASLPSSGPLSDQASPSAAYSCTGVSSQSPVLMYSSCNCCDMLSSPADEASPNLF